MRTFFLAASLFGILPVMAQVAVPPVNNKAPEAPPAAAMESNTRSIMMIEPKNRATDFQQAFEILRKEKTAAKVYFQLASGTNISNIIDMTLLGNGSLILFRYNSPQGIKIQVVGVEEIVGISHF